MQPDLISYNSVLHACAQKGDMKRAKQWLTKMLRKGIVPTSMTYNILIDTCVKASDIEAAESWLACMSKDTWVTLPGILSSLSKDVVMPTDVSFTTVMYGHCKNGDVARAEELLQKMIDAGVEPGAASYNCLICTRARFGQSATAEKWALEMEARGLVPTVSA